MARFKQGDKIRVDGQLATVMSWPHDDNGMFVITIRMKDGGENWMTLHTGVTNQEIEPVHETVNNIELVEAGEPVSSTLTDADLADDAPAVGALVELAPKPVKRGPGRPKKAAA